jgi:hypothetical protein
MLPKSAKGPISNLGGNVLFGPKLTQSKLNRIFRPGQDSQDFANWNNASAGEKAGRLDPAQWSHNIWALAWGS